MRMSVVVFVWSVGYFSKWYKQFRAFHFVRSLLSIIMASIFFF